MNYLNYSINKLYKKKKKTNHLYIIFFFYFYLFNINDKSSYENMSITW